MKCEPDTMTIATMIMFSALFVMAAAHVAALRAQRSRPPLPTSFENVPLRIHRPGSFQ